MRAEALVGPKIVIVKSILDTTVVFLSKRMRPSVANSIRLGKIGAVPTGRDEEAPAALFPA